MTFTEWLISPEGAEFTRALIVLMTAASAYMLWRVHRNTKGK